MLPLCIIRLLLWLAGPPARPSHRVLAPFVYSTPNPDFLDHCVVCLEFAARCRFYRLSCLLHTVSLSLTLPHVSPDVLHALLKSPLRLAAETFRNDLQRDLDAPSWLLIARPIMRFYACFLVSAAVVSAQTLYGPLVATSRPARPSGAELAFASSFTSVLV
jgi:hypothetical protein